MKNCKIDGCDGKHEARGYCAKHYMRLKTQGKFFDSGECSVDQCSNRIYAKGLCRRHYEQVQRGKGIRRTSNDPNDFIVEDDICRILIYDKNAKYKHTALIDTEDLGLINKYKWMSAISKGEALYVRTKIKRKVVPIHRIILAHQLNDALEVDHINHDGLDNRKINLRVCTRSQNMQNQRLSIRNTSGYKGVFRADKKWGASIKKDGNPVHIGIFEDKIDAAIAYNNAAIHLFSEFACLNEGI